MKKLLFYVIMALGLNSVALLVHGCAEAQAAEPPVKNVIYMIGDGMSLTHMAAAMLSQDMPLALERAQYVGIQKTQPAKGGKVTDSAASGTALASGTKTYNGAIGVDLDKQPLYSVLARSEARGLATGVVATYSVTNATPASFVAHNESRKNEEAIAEDYLKTNIDVFIGGGRQFFEKRADGRNLSQDLKAKGYTMAYTMDEVKGVEKGRLAALLADNALPRMINGRGDMLPAATAQALKILSRNNKGFFIMVEGSQIDGGGHANDGEAVITETLDFDAAVKVAFDFADAHPGTLVVVTADHETGGMTLAGNDQGGLDAKFTTTGHTGVPVPVYAYGAGAQHFTGIMDNTDIPKRIAKLLNLK